MDFSYRSEQVEGGGQRSSQGTREGSLATNATRARPKSANSSMRSREDLSNIHSKPGAQRPSSRSLMIAKTAGSLLFELETVKDELYYQHELAEAAAHRIQLIEQERSELTADYEHRVQALDGAIDEDNRELVNTNIGVQTMTVQLTTLAMRERELLEERTGLKQTLDREKAAIQRVKQEYQLREKELNQILSEQELKAHELETSLRGEQDEALRLKRQLVAHQKELAKIREGKRVPPLSVDVMLKGRAPALPSGTGDSDRFFFQLEMPELMQAVPNVDRRDAQFVRLQRFYELHLQELREIFRYYAFLGEVSIEAPFSVTGGQLEHLMGDAGIKLDPISLSKVFLPFAITSQAQALKRREGAMNRSLTMPVPPGGGSLKTADLKVKKAEVPRLRSQTSSCILDFDSFVAFLTRVAFQKFDPSQAKPTKKKKSAAAIIAANAEKERAEKEKAEKERARDNFVNKGKEGGGGSLASTSKSDRPVDGVSDLFYNVEKLFSDFIFPKCRKMTDDITFQAQLDSTEVRAAVYEARPRLRLHFTQALAMFSDAYWFEHDAKKEMTASQWLAYCDRQKLLSGTRLTVAQATLIFVEVYDNGFLERVMDEAMTLDQARGIAMGALKKKQRKPPVIIMKGFEECIVRAANAYYTDSSEITALAMRVTNFVLELLDTHHDAAARGQDSFSGNRGYESGDDY